MTSDGECCNFVLKVSQSLLDHLMPKQDCFSGIFGPVGRVFGNGPGDRGLIPGRVIPKTFKKWYLIPPCLTLSNVKVCIKGKEEQSRERSSALSDILKREPSGHPRLKGDNFIFTFYLFLFHKNNHLFSCSYCCILIYMFMQDIYWHNE